MSRMVSLEDWAKDEFGDLAPGIATLQRYAKCKMMAPPAVKVGRKWMIDRESRFAGVLAQPRLSEKAHPKLRSIIEDGFKTPNS